MSLFKPATPRQRRIVQALLSIPLTVVINLLIGVFITVMRGGHGLWENVTIAEAIGMSICLINVAAVWLRNFERLPTWMLVLIVTSGAASGLLIASTILDNALAAKMLAQPQYLWAVLGNIAVFGTIVTYFFESRRNLISTRDRLQDEQLRNAQAARQMAEVQLRLLQAQIEPHFLFNTLSNILSLVDAAPPQAKAMLEHLTRYLRVSLQRTREGDSTLAEELDLLRAYLEIQSIRMGARLQYTIQEPGTLGSTPIPPLLIQPLVENAVTHGLAPQVAGGKVDIRFQANGAGLQIEVADTGRGMIDQVGSGVGLKNIRDRLTGLYGAAAQLNLRQNSPTGVVATLTLPLHRA